MSTPSSTPPLSRKAIFAQAWPIMLGQASVPLVGIVDAAIIGRTGDTIALAGVALGATIISLIFWSFGFLRMGMTGLAANAHGAGDKAEVDALLLRGLGIGIVIGVILFALSIPLSWAAFAIVSGSEAVTSNASDYVEARFFGASAALATYGVNGWLLGLGRTREALTLHIITNLANIILDVTFVWGFDMGAYGVGLGTALAEWIALIAGLVLVGRVAGANILALIAKTSRAALLNREKLAKLFAVNRDIMIRTIALLTMFLWFANAGARINATALAANHVLMQFISVAAFILDAFAYTAEERVGHALGSKSKANFLRAIRLTGEFSLLSGIVLAALFFIAGQATIELISTDPAVRAEAARFLPFVCLAPIIGAASWMMDGIFVGATRTNAMRNAAVLATALYIALDLSLRGYGNMGAWIAITASYGLRAICLGAYFPTLLRHVSAK